MKKIDRRITRTRRLLGEALLELVQEQSFDAITIRDITERADIGYATFFRHYASKEELLAEQLENIIRQIEALAGDRTGDYFRREGALLYEHARENELLYQGLLGGHVDAQVIRRLRDALIKVIRPHVEGHVKEEEFLVPFDLVVNHVAAATLEMLVWWLENEMPYPPDEMGLFYERLIIRATWNAILPPELETHI